MCRKLLFIFFALALTMGASAQRRTTSSKTTTTSTVKNTSRKPSSTSQNTKTTSKGPVMSFETTQHNFGKVQLNKSKKWVAKFKNTGDEKLVIAGVNVFCNCMKADVPKDVIAPGESGQITVTFTGESMGDFMKNLQVYTNCSSPMTRLYIEGTVVSK